MISEGPQLFALLRGKLAAVGFALEEACILHLEGTRATVEDLGVDGLLQVGERSACPPLCGVTKH